MKRHIKLKKKIKLIRKIKLKEVKISTKVIISIILVVIAILSTFFYINKKASPILMSYAEVEMKKLSTMIINKAVSKQVTDKMQFDKLFIIDKNSKGEINTIDFNSIVVNEVLSTCTSAVQLNLKYALDGRLDLLGIPQELLTPYIKNKPQKGIIYEVPSGLIFRNSFLANLGPKIPVRLNLVGNIESNINTRIKDYGINSALIEVFITIKVEEMVIMPFLSKTISVSSNVPVAMKLISGNIPNSYYGNIAATDSKFSIPLN